MSPDPKALVSVVVAARNEEHHLEESLLSILGQTGAFLELVFVDDNSTDRTLDIAQLLSQRDSRISVFQNPRQGKCAAFNYGVGQARGRYVCIFAGDDVMPPGSLAKRLEAVFQLPDDRPGVGLSKILTMSAVARFDGHLVPRAAGRGALSGVSPLMNRKALEMIFPVPESLPNEDTWMELAVLYLPGWNIVHSDTVCCHWRVHGGNSINMTVGYHEYNRRITERFKALPMFFNKYAGLMTPEQQEALQRQIDCEQRRVAGDVLGVLCSKVSLVDRLRALSITNRYFYEIRRRLFGILSGW